VNTTNESTGASNGIAVRGVGDIGVRNDPTIFPKLDDETYRNSKAIVIWVYKCCKN
jgi:hypothetical protein